jgi:hypothetical protein
MRKTREQADEARRGKSVFKSFGALSFGAGRVTGAIAPAPGVAQPRLTPESVWDFNAHKDGCANSNLGQPVSLGGRQGIGSHAKWEI